MIEHSANRNAGPGSSRFTGVTQVADEEERQVMVVDIPVFAVVATVLVAAGVFSWSRSPGRIRARQ